MNYARTSDFRKLCLPLFLSRRLGTYSHASVARYCTRGLGILVFLVALVATSSGNCQEPPAKVGTTEKIAAKLKELGQFVAVYEEDGHQFVVVMLEVSSLESLRLVNKLDYVDELYVIKWKIGPQESKLLEKAPVNNLMLCWDCQFVKGDIRFLNKLKQVKHIEFRGCEIDGGGLSDFPPDSQLEMIILMDCTLKNGGRLTLPEGLKEFDHLRLTNTNIDKTSFVAAMKQPAMGHAQFVNSGIEKEWLDELDSVETTSLLVIRPRLPDKVKQDYKKKHPKAWLR